MKTLLVLSGLLAVAVPALAADHPGSDAKCETCHAVGKAESGAPAVMPAQPGFFAKLMGEKSLAGHPSVSCSGAVRADGSLSGCHRPEDGKQNLLVLDLADQAVDVFCAKCHPDQRKPGAHHPSYTLDRNQDGVPDGMVRPAEGQEIYAEWAPSAKGAPLSRFPDALVLSAQPDGTKKLEAVLPLATVVQVGPDGQPVTEANVVTCSTCHNPHFGYLVEVGSEEALNRGQVAREQGDALLRVRDYDNTLCDACH